MKRSLLLAGMLLPGFFVFPVFASSLSSTSSGAGGDAPANAPAAVEAALIGSWQEAERLFSARYGAGAAYFPANGKFYVLGGEVIGGGIPNLPIEEYDPAADQWTNVNVLLIDVADAGAAQVGDYIYVPGGRTAATGATDKLQRFDPANNIVEIKFQLPAPNFAHAVAVQDGMIYVLGGSTTGAAGTTNYIYDTTTETWSLGEPPPVATSYAAATSDGRYIYLAGGLSSGSDLDVVQRYDPHLNIWDTVANLGAARGGPGAFFDGSAVRVVGGGWTQYWRSTEVYDVDADRWDFGPPNLVGARSIAVAFGNGMALKAGGWNGVDLPNVEVLRFPVLLPDALIKTSGDYVGDDVYNETGKKQARLARPAHGESAVFRIRLENDGNVPDRLRVRGPDDKAGLSVRYFKGGRDITGKVKRGAYKTKLLAPGDRSVIRLVVTDRRSARFGLSRYPSVARSWNVVVSSQKNPAKSDTVKAKVRATGRR